MNTLTHDEGLEEVNTSDDKLREVHADAMCEFAEDVLPQIPVRELALQARRFASIPGAQWDGAWGDMLENSIKVEIDKIGSGLRKLRNDYRQNRIMPDFRPDGGDSDQDTADTLDGMYRADAQRFGAQQGYDNAFEEGSAGGMGAWRLSNEYADPLDKDDDAQRVNPGLIIPDADQCVFFDANSKTYDKSDARRGWVLTSLTPDAYKAEYDDEPVASWETATLRLNYMQYPWFRPDYVVIAEYYKVEVVDDKVAVFTHVLTNDEERYWSSEITPEQARLKVAQGWQKRMRKGKRQRVRKYVLSGNKVLKDCGYIAGPNIPIVPYYGNRAYVDGIEWFIGYVQKKMDAQRTYNLQISKLAETSALAPREVPIFHPDQMTGNLPDLWAEANINRSPYLLANGVMNPDGTFAQLGPVGKVDPPQMGPVTSALIEVSNRDLMEDQQDTDQVKANVSAEAMDIAATRVDERSGIYLDNFRLSMKRAGEIYLGMEREISFEPGRVVETMDEEGGDGTATLHETYMDGDVAKTRNDFSVGRYKVLADVTEATSTRKDKTVKSSLSIASVAIEAQNASLANAAVLTAVMNQEGEGMEDLQKFARKQGLEIGLVEPNEDEKRAAEQAQQSAPPDATQQLAAAQAGALQASAAKDAATAQKTTVDAKLSEAKIIETLTKAALNRRQAEENPEPDLPTPANDAELAEKWARADLHSAQADDLRAEIPLKHIRTGAQLADAEHARQLALRQQDHAERTASA